ncbi:MAG: electron transfer flavoprotein subunit beta [Motiliproteus sp.]
MQPDLNVVSLVSIGRHPSSGRERRSEQDGRAVELGLKLAGTGLTALHAGAAEAPALRSYAGMGLPTIKVLEQNPDADAVPRIIDYLKSASPDIVLTGVRAESGESSGMLPYLLGNALGWPVVTRIADIVKVENGKAEILQALPRGQRRALSVSLPFVASVDLAAAEPRQSAYGPGSRAQMETLTDCGTVDVEKKNWSEAPARKRPKRLKVVKAKTAADRFKAATAKVQGGGGKVLKDQPASEQAQAIFDLLLEEGVIR